MSQKILISSTPEATATYLILSHLRTKTKVYRVLIREMLFTHSEEAPQRLISCFSNVYREFSLTISLKKGNIMGQHVDTTPTITIDEQVMEVITYLGSTISNNLSLGAD
ncbi:hypothetical protein ElyMa_003570400 [Elysia marginata]|uniref:Selenoprotein F/M domain-containing protein n=1 Tax=Elysia marginata TaxID=1093978 RepID=A0AAV4ENZ0_9GAST|nr:hypothetical protein ElyMa_003570400 [Elysia marginata]